MAVAAIKPNEPQRWTYKDLLDGSRGVFVPSFKEPSSPQEIGEKLQGLKPTKIKEILRDRRARLQKMVEYIDCEVSPRDLPLEFLSKMQKDFRQQIHIVINKIPRPGDYIGNQQGMSDSFKQVTPALEAAIAALQARNNLLGTLTNQDKTIKLDRNEDAMFTLIQDIIEKNTRAYAFLQTATEHLEAGLNYWDKSENQPAAEGADSAAYASESIQRIQQQKKAAGIICDALLYRDADEPFGRPTLEQFERRLREETLATLLPILQPAMRDDEALRKPLVHPDLVVYESYSTITISSLRKARNALNLALDEYEYITPPLVLTSEHLSKHLDDCSTELENAFKDWR